MSLATGVVRALWSLVTPLHFQPRAPTRPAQRFGARRLLADVYLPQTSRGAAGVLLIHGGGFLIGSRRMKPVRLLATRLAEAGIASCAIDYRLVLRGGDLARAADDVAHAARWWLRTASELGLDEHRQSLLGLSAGGTLALLTAAREDAAAYARVVGIFGLYDLAHLRGPMARLLPRLLLSSGDPAAWTAASPLGRPDTPAPMLLVHGDEDLLVPVEQARALAARRDEAGLPTRYLELPGEPHAFFNWPGPASDRALAEILDFLR